MTLRIAMASDERMVGAALVMLGSVLERASRAVELHFLGYALSPATRERIAAFCAARDCALVHHEVTDALFGEARQVNANIPLVAMARLWLPHWLTGRVLYLDCDMLALADIAEIFDADLGGQPLGAVRDFYVLDQVKAGAERPGKLAWHREVLGREDVSGYFNSGLLLMDCEAIRADADLMTRMTAISDAQGYRFMDQDYLNVLFDGRVQYLPQAWNSIWGRDALRARTLARLPWLPEAEKTPSRACVIHYTGPRKPWKAQSLVSAALRGRLPALLKWRRAARRIGEGMPG